MDKLLKKIKTDFNCRFWKLVSPIVPQFFRIVSRETGHESRQSNGAVVYVGSCHHRGQTSKSLFLFIIAGISFTS